MEYRSIPDNFFVPDRRDIFKDKLKYVWRRIAFYLFIVFFCFFTIRLPDQIVSPAVWFWALHVLYFELDVTNRRNAIFIRLFHASSFSGAFVSAAFFLVVVISNPSWVSDRSQSERRSLLLGWIVNVWLHWLPPIWHILDIYLYRSELTDRHSIRLWKNLKRVVIAQNIAKVVWIALSGPLVVLVWRLCGWTLDVIYVGVHEATLVPVLIPVMVAVHIASVILLVFFIRKKPSGDMANRINPVNT